MFIAYPKLILKRLLLLSMYLVIAILIITSRHSVLAQDEIVLDQIRSIVWSPDGKQIATAYQNGKIEIISVKGEQIVLDLTGHKSAVVAIAWSPNGHMLASGSLYPDTTLNIWDTTTGQLIFTQSDFGVDVVAVGWQPDSSQVIAITAEPFIDETNSIMVDPMSGKVTSLHLGGSADIVWSPDRRSIASANMGGVGVYDANPLQILYGIPVDLQTYPVRVSWSPDGKLIAAGTADGRVFLWNENSSEPILTLIGSNYEGEDRFVRWIQDLRFDASGQQLTSVAGDGTIRTWDVKRGELVAEQKTSLSYTAAFSPYGGRVALGLLASDSSNIDQSDDTILKDVAVQIIVPDASIENLESIAGQCFEEGSGAQVEDLQSIIISETDLTDFIAQIEALPADAIPAACQADLIAVAEAIIAQE